jgi:hypothetical protein
MIAGRGQAVAEEVAGWRKDAGTGELIQGKG